MLWLKIKSFIFLILCLWFQGSLADPKNLGTTRIIGGWETSINYFPYQVSVQVMYNHICGGSILSTDIILTAGHCLTMYSDVRWYNIRAGSSYISQGGVVIGIKAMKIHEQYNQPSFGNNDLGIMKLLTPLTFGNTILPIPLMAVNEVLPDMASLYVSGFGFTQPEDQQYSPVLRYTVIDKLPLSECSEAYSNATTITDNMICAGFLPNGGRDSCKGDSGGPLMGVINNSIRLVGLIAFGLGCGDPQYPGVYTRVQLYQSWITQNSLTLN